METAYIERFNSRLRDECLNQYWFLTPADARQTIERWRQAYNTARPHRALKHLTPAQFAAHFQEAKLTGLSA